MADIVNPNNELEVRPTNPNYIRSKIEYEPFDDRIKKAVREALQIRSKTDGIAEGLNPIKLGLTRQNQRGTFKTSALLLPGKSEQNA